MGYEEFFVKQEVKNTELKGVASFIHKCAVNSGLSQSSGLNHGLDPNTVVKQAGYIAASKARLEALRDRPFPDLPQSHPIQVMCDVSNEPPIVRGTSGNVVNDDVLAVTIGWQRIAFELVRSNSAGQPGSMTSFDYERTVKNIDALEQLIATFDEEVMGVDFSETTDPAAKPSRKGGK